MHMKYCYNISKFVHLIVNHISDMKMPCRIINIYYEVTLCPAARHLKLKLSMPGSSKI